MFSFFRQWCERKARLCIARAISEQLDYEPPHAERQQERLQHIEHDRHGEYDHDQRALSVELRVRAAYQAAHKKPPRHLHELVLEALQ